MYIDLHMHTTASDGAYTRQELLNLLIQNNITTFAITDHDTTKNSVPMIAEAKKHNMRCLIGVEATCRHPNGVEHHITCYGFDPTNPELQSMLSKNATQRHSLNHKVVHLMAKQDSRIDISQFENYTYNPKRGGWTSLNFFIDQGVISNIPEFFKYVKDLNIRAEYPPPETIIQTVKNAGGIPCLAHPSAYKGGEPLPESELKQWVDFGIAGIECYSPYVTDPIHTQNYITFCKQHNLFISGGSDFHGPFLNRPLDKLKLTPDMLHLGNLLEEHL